MIIANRNRRFVTFYTLTLNAKNEASYFKPHRPGADEWRRKIFETHRLHTWVNNISETFSHIKQAFNWMDVHRARFCRKLGDDAEIRGARRPFFGQAILYTVL